jgi:anti-sigma B factor antagonist
MDINVKKNGVEMLVELDGRLDTTSAPELEKSLVAEWDDVENLVFDFAALRYVSSAGLRVLLGSQKKMNAKGGTMVIKHVNETVMEVFDVTGFLDILTVKNDD